jgi:hypothetical protein
MIPARLSVVTLGTDDLLSDPRDAEWGGRSANVLEPKGNRWEVAWAPGAVSGDRGEIVPFGG